MTSLERDLRLSIQFKNMQDAIVGLLDLARKEYASLAEPSTTRCAAMSIVVAESAAQWADAILAAEKALQPVTPEPIPALICNACDRETPVTIMGLCIKCDDFRQAIAEAITECEVIEIPRRIQ